MHVSCSYPALLMRPPGKAFLRMPSYAASTSKVRIPFMYAATRKAVEWDPIITKV